MSDPLRTETSRTPEPASRAERDAKIEQLLLAGLDDYFAGRYDQAINVWTRALFLDRSHARARAYIERARSAQAERQREVEALLQDGAAAIRRGDGAEARRLVDAAMARGEATDEVLALLDRVERLEHSVRSAAVPDEFEAPRLVLDEAAPPGRPVVAWVALGAFVLVIIAAGVFALSGAQWGPLVDRALARRSDRSAPATANTREMTTLPVPRRSEFALAHARALISSGKLRDALPVLESIRITDPERAEADRLRADVQRQLIALGPLPLLPASPTTPSITDGLVR